MSDTPFADAAAKSAEAVEEQVDETAAEREAREQEEAKAAFFAQLSDRFGDEAPSEAQLDEWKEAFGRIRWMELGSDEIYFFRPFKTNEYNGWIQSLQQLAEKDPEQADRRLRERIVTACVVFPKIDPETTGAQFAGTIETLFAQIRLSSNFIPLELASTMVREW